MSNQEILDKAPEGATYIDSANVYIKKERNGIFTSYFAFQGGAWVDADDYKILLTRSLTDIKRIAELEDFVRDYASETCACRYPTICSKCKEIAYAKEILKGCE